MASERRTGLELLRILAVCGVILLHYNNPRIGNAFEYASGGGNLAILYLLESLFCCAVNIFIVITGYFMCINNVRAIKKPLSLILLLVLLNVLFYSYSLMAGNNVFSLGGLANEILPHNYYVTLYIALFFISPYINKLLVSFNKSDWRLFLIITLLLFSLWPTLGDMLKELTNEEWFGISTIGAWGSQSGHNIVNFILLYCIGAFIRLNEIDKKNISTLKLLVSLFICVGVLFCWSFFSSHEVSSMGRSAWAYHNPFVIFIAIILFLLFSRLDFSSKLINELAKATFTCFLMHGHIITHLRIEHFVQQPAIIMIAHIVSCMIICLVVSYITWKVYDFVVDKHINKYIKYNIVYK